MEQALQDWLAYHLQNTWADYLILALWGAFAGLAWSQITYQRLIVPRVYRWDGKGVQLGFLGVLIIGIFIALVVDYYPPVAASVSFLVFAGINYVQRRIRQSPQQSVQDVLFQIHRQNLDRLQIAAAKYGMNVPLEIQNAIKFELEEIEHLSGEQDEPLS